MAEFRFTREFLSQLGDIERIVSPVEFDTLERALSEIVDNPQVSDRFASHYDPAEPSYFVRRDPFLIRYSLDRDGVVLFRTLFRRSV